MADQPVVQRSGAEVANAPAKVISEWLHEGALQDLMDGNDPASHRRSRCPLPILLPSPVTPISELDRGRKGW